MTEMTDKSGFSRGYKEKGSRELLADTDGELC